MHRKVAAALVAALALGVASCGGSDSEPLTRAQLRTRIETACRRAQERTEAAAREAASTAPRERSEAQTAELLVTATLVGQGHLVEQLGELEPPENLQDAFDSFQQGSEDRRALLEEAGADIRENGAAAVRQIQRRLEPIQEQLTTAARELGVEGCA